MSEPTDVVTLAPPKRMVVGVNISTTSYGEVTNVCSQWCVDHRRWREGQQSSQPRGHYICVTSVHGVITSRDDNSLRDILNSADIATPDGMPLVWALRSFGCKEQSRVYGPTLMLSLCERAAVDGLKIFLYGGRPETLPRLAARLQEMFPKLQIAGMHSPPFRAMTMEEDRSVTEEIVNSGADLVFVGISTPKQEKWMHAHQDTLPGVVMVGVGAAFDFHAGRVKQAPAWMQKAGLEWFFRLLMEPVRLWRRYLLVTPRFLPLWAMQRLTLLFRQHAH